MGPCSLLSGFKVVFPGYRKNPLWLSRQINTFIFLTIIAMKTMLDEGTRETIIGRIRSLKQDSPRQWGKMTPYQMVRHCIQWEDLSQGRKKFKQVFIGRLFGRMALRDVLKDEKPIGRNKQTLRELRMTGDGDIEPEKRKWISMLDSYRRLATAPLVHPFFGKMTPEQMGELAYKHMDHHLRQFGC